MLANAVGPQDAAKIVPAKYPIHKTEGGCHSEINKITILTPNIAIRPALMPLCVSLSLSFNPTKSLATLLPINCKNVEQDEIAAAIIPDRTITPIQVGTIFI